MANTGVFCCRIRSCHAFINSSISFTVVVWIIWGMQKTTAQLNTDSSLASHILRKHGPADEDGAGALPGSHDHNAAILSNHQPSPIKQGVILYARFRSGSTFTGEMLRQHSDIYYVYEPLHHSKRLTVLPVDTVKSCLANQLQCRLDQRPNVASILWQTKICQDNWPPPCDDMSTEGHMDRCRQKKLVAVKVIRVKKLVHLEDFMEANVLVIHLVRDPRGLFRSWRGFGRFPGNDVAGMNRTAHEYCDAMHEDIQFMNSARGRKLRGSYLLMRYEDIIYDPQRHINAIFGAIGIEQDHAVKQWVKEIYRQKNGSSEYLGKHTSLSVHSQAPDEEPVKWRHSFDIAVVRLIQEACGPMMKELGYLPVENAEQMHDSSFSTVDYGWKPNQT